MSRMQSLTTPDEFPSMVEALRSVVAHKDAFTEEEWAAVEMWVERGVAFMELNLPARPGDGGGIRQADPDARQSRRAGLRLLGDLAA